MSNIKTLTEKIINDAEKKYQSQVKEAKQEIESQEQLKKQQLEVQSKERLAAFEKEQRKEMYLQISETHIQSRNKILTAKQAVLNELFTEALQKLNELSQEEFDRFVSRGISQAQLEGSTELLLGEKSTKYLNDDRFKRWKSSAASDLEIQLSKKVVPNRSGFLLRQADIELNFTFEALIAASKEDLSNQLLQLIFEQ